jgi:hypothetical protein
MQNGSDKSVAGVVILLKLKTKYSVAVNNLS